MGLLMSMVRTHMMPLKPPKQGGKERKIWTKRETRANL